MSSGLEPDADRAVSIDLVTVVFAAELSLLVLQARSIARHFDPDALGRIVVILNDPDEAGCRRGVEGMRGEYGRFADRLRIVSPSELLDEPRGLLARARAAWVAGGRTKARRLLRGRRRRGGNPAGWCGNSGWAMQQAFKLLSARACSATHIVMLDAKNHFLRPVDAARFVAADGRARSRSLVPDAKQLSWAEASFAALGLPLPAGEVPPTVTPFAIERSVLAECAATLARRLGPLECHFALRRGRTTEFMLLYAALDRGDGLWWRRFARGLPAALTVFRPTEAEVADAADGGRAIGVVGETRVAGNDPMLDVVRELRRRPALVAGVHRTRVRELGGETRSELLALWMDHGLVVDGDELDRLFPMPARLT